MKKLEDINYALMAQLSYLHWNKIEDKKIIENKLIKRILFTDIVLTQIKTEFYDDQEHYPSNEIINEKKGKLPPYVYHEEDKRLFLTYSTEKTDDQTKTKFGKILDGWQYLDCASGEMIQKNLFDKSLLAKYDDSGFFGVAFQRNDDIIIAYRGTEFELALARDMVTDLKIYNKYTDIQQVEAVLFYEYIKSKYGAGKDIHLTGHSLAGAIAQYVHFYAKCNGDEVVTLTWNGLGSFGSVITSFEFHLDPNIDSEFKNKINSIQNKTIKDNLIKFYSKKKEELIKKREEIKDTDHIFNFFMSEDFVGGYLNGDWLGQKQPVDISKEEFSENLEVLPQLLLIASLLKNGKYSLKNKDILTKIAFIYLASSFGGTIESVKENMDNIEKNSNNSELTDLFKILKVVDISQFKDFGEDMINNLLNLFDEDGITENSKQTLDELRRFGEKALLPMKIFEKGNSALAFHNVNNFLMFMKDDGNIEFHQMREDFRFNALKTIVILKKDKNYRFLKGKNRNNPSENILEIQNKEVKSRIIVPANRLLQGNVFVAYPITQTDLLFKNVFKKKKFNGEDMTLRNNVLDGKYNGELELGKYNNVKRLGGIIGESPLIIKIYPLDTGIEEKKVEEKRVITFGIERKNHGIY